jgi:hypothetical protein
LINRQLNADDLAGMLTLYGAARQAHGDGPLPVWAYGALALLLLSMTAYVEGKQLKA